MHDEPPTVASDFDLVLVLEPCIVFADFTPYVDPYYPAIYVGHSFKYLIGTPGCTRDSVCCLQIQYSLGFCTILIHKQFLI